MCQDVGASMPNDFQNSLAFRLSSRFIIVFLKIPDARLTTSFSRPTWVSRHQKGETSQDFNEARDDGMAVTSAGPYANYSHLAPNR